MHNTHIVLVEYLLHCDCINKIHLHVKCGVGEGGGGRGEGVLCKHMLVRESLRTRTVFHYILM